MSAPDFESSTVAQDEPWRQEIASRVNSYRRRRGRKIEGEFSMRLDFEPAPASHGPVAQAVAERMPEPEVSLDINYFRRTNAAPAPDYEPEPSFREFVLDSEPAVSGYDPDFDFDRPRFEEHPQADEPANVIIFPTQPTYQPPPPPPAYELAERVLDRPRILDVPEEILPTISGPLFANIRLDTDAEDEAIPSAPLHIDVPLPVAMVNDRIYSAVIDWTVVICGSAIAAAAAWKFSPEIPHTRILLGALVATPILLWLAFQYIFITYAGRTPGMQVTNLRLANFEGGSPDFQRRRQRALSMFVSLISGGVGIGWALLDPDMLCWHDSISRTYVTQER